MNPTRPGVGPLLATGGVYVSDYAVNDLENSLNNLCLTFGFPVNEEFKWSPGRECWMRDNLVGIRRTEFFHTAIGLARERNVKAIVVVEDTHQNTATDAQTAEMDVTNLLLERVHGELKGAGSHGVFISDRPGGDRDRETRFLTDCLETLSSGTDYVQFEKFAINAVSTPSKLVRLIQLADVITSCTTAFIAGEHKYSPPVFGEIRELFVRNLGRVGGCGLKIHPDFRYANLYHWLVGDTQLVRYPGAFDLPLKNYPYYEGPDKP